MKKSNELMFIKRVSYNILKELNSKKSFARINSIRHPGQAIQSLKKRGLIEASKAIPDLYIITDAGKEALEKAVIYDEYPGRKIYTEFLKEKRIESFLEKPVDSLSDKDAELNWQIKGTSIKTGEAPEDILNEFFDFLADNGVEVFDIQRLYNAFLVIREAKKC